VSVDNRRSVATNLFRASMVAWVLQSTVSTEYEQTWLLGKSGFRECEACTGQCLSGRRRTEWIEL